MTTTEGTVFTLMKLEIFRSKCRKLGISFVY